jgi:DNA polymerase-3 subunit delta'
MGWDLIGHDWAENLLRKHIHTEQVRHAYLITGEQGVGKRTLAMSFAQALLCSGDRQQGLGCGRCRACQLVLELQFPDFHLLIPEDQTSSIKVDQVRELIGQLSLAPYESESRFALIPDFEHATESAANALLKTLEEPGDQVVVVLTARDPASLLPTIVSRCEHLPLRAVSREIICNAIQQRTEDSDQVELLSGLAQGRPGWAIRYAEEPEFFTLRSDRLDELEELLGQSRVERFNQVEDMLPLKGDLETQRNYALTTIQFWMDIWRDAMQQGYRADIEVINADRVDLINFLKTKLKPEQLHQALESLHRAQDAINRYANVRLTMEVLMLDLPIIKQ